MVQDTDSLVNIFIVLSVILFLVSFVTLFSISITSLGKYLSKQELSKNRIFYPMRLLLKKFLNKNGLNFLQFSANFTRHLFYILYAITALMFLNFLFTINLMHSIVISIIIIVLFIVIDITMRIFATLGPIQALRISSLVTTILLTILFHLTFPLYLLITFTL